MTDRDDRTEARVRAAFQSEERRAESDLRHHPIAPPPPRPSRTTARLAAVAAVVLLMVGFAGVVAVVRHGTPDPGASARPSAPVAPSTTAPAGITAAVPGDRYPDGIPLAWQSQPVLRWDQALDRSRTAADATPFLAAAWLNIPVGVVSCPNDPGPDPSAPNSWISRGGCPLNHVSTDAGASPGTQNGVVTFRFLQTKLTTGPAIMRVHTRDPRAVQCGAQQAVCLKMLVVDEILWTGDTATAPHPLDVNQVIAATRAASPTSNLLAPGQTVFGCGANATDGLTLCPPLEPGTQYTTPIAGAVVLPSSDAIARAIPDVEPGAAGALNARALWTQGGSSGSWEYRWLVVDNVAILVRTSAGGPSASDRAFLVTLESALKGQENGVSPSP